MALVTCKECGNQVSAAAKACPQCGAKGRALRGRRKMGVFGMMGVGLLGISAIGTAIGISSQPPEASKKEDPAQSALDEKRDVNIVTYARSLKAAMRDPDSLSFDRVTTNNDGSLVCFSYRARNGFGGLNRERVAFSPKGGSKERRVVNTICSDKDMTDVTGAAKSLIETIG